MNQITTEGPRDMAMTKANKSLLRWLVRHNPEMSDEAMADECECSVSTVKKYRKHLNPERKKL